MTTVRVFDPAMCCSTGICGPSVDPELARFAADLAWLEGQGVAVERFNLAQQPAAFVGDVEVRAALEAQGADALPLVKVNDAAKSSGVYPSRAELAAWAGLGDAPARPVEAIATPKATGGGCCGGAGKASTSTKSGGGCC